MAQPHDAPRPRRSGSPAGASKDFRGTPGDLRRARRFVLEHVPAEVAADAELLVSELASNVVLHAGTSFEVGIVPRHRSVRIEVVDHAPVMPRRRTPGSDDSSGRGLLIVDQLAADWGCVPFATGKRVWFELTY